ncbi:hypothetical protein M9Y10_028956 [Tritrichomonas musculus]|uniref:Uncharacterized protein n=1 Tax=Tritrichomonas musculus TaxID=1915356 RepID=A0ABR2KLN4_9EUKA
MNKTAPARNTNSNYQTSTTKKTRGPLSPTRKGVGVERESPFKKSNTVKAKTVPKQKQALQSPNQEQKIDKKKEEAQKQKQKDIENYYQLLEERDQKIAQRNELLQRKEELERQKQQLQQNSENHDNFNE